MTKTGAGILSLSGTASNFTGLTTVSAGTLAFTNAGALGAGDVILNGGELRATATATLARPITISKMTGTISAAPGANLTLTNLLAQGGNLTVGATGQTGIVTFTPSARAASPTVTLTVNAGTLRAGNFNGVDFYTSNTAGTTVNAGATLDLNGFSTGITNLQGAGAITTGGTAATVLTVNAGSFSGAISGPGALTKTTAGTLTLTGANTYAGPTTISAGTLQVGNGGTGGTLGSGNVTNNAGLVVNRSDALSYNGVVSGTGTLTKQGAGTLTLGGATANTFTGLTSVTAGTLVLDKSTFVHAVEGDLSIGNVTTPGAAGSVVVRVNNNNQAGSGTNVTVLPDGLLDINGRVFTMGSLTMTGGTLACGGDQGGPSLNGDVTINASTAGSRITSTDSLGGNVFLQNMTRTFTVADGPARYDLDVNAGLFLGVLIKAGPGVLRLDGANSTTNLPVTLNAGTLAVGRDTALRGGADLTLAGGVIVADGGSGADAGARTVTRTINVTGNATVGSALDGTAGGLTFTGVTSLAASTMLTVSSNAPTTFTEVISGAGGLVKTGAGTLTLSNAANTFTGGLKLNGGTLAIAGEGSLGGPANVVTLNAGRLQFTASATTARTFNFNNALTLSTAAGTTLTFGNGAGVNGGFLGAGGTLAFTDGAALNGTTTALGSVVTTSGAVGFTNVTLRGAATVAAAGTLTANDLAVASAGTLTVNGTVNTAGLGSDGVLRVNVGGTLANTGATLTLGGGSRTFIGAVGAPGGTLSTAAGTSIELNGGLLTNNGAQTGTLNVNYGSTVKGAGSFGTVVVSDGGRFSPGNSPGTVSVASFEFGAGSRYDFELNNATAASTTPGAGADLLSVRGALTLGAGTTANSRFVVGLFTLDQSNAPAMLPDFDANRPYTFTLATAGQAITTFDPAEASVETSGFLNATNGGRFSVALSPDARSLLLQFNPVPEPGAWALLAAGGLGLLGARRCHTRRRHG